VVVATGVLVLANSRAGLAELGAAGPTVEFVSWVLIFGAASAVLVRYGFLAFVVTAFVVSKLVQFPLTLDASHWYSGTSLVVMLALAAIALWALRVATAPVRRLDGASGRQLS
jgi:hypothetical protein